MKCHILWHFIWAFTVCQSTPLVVSSIQRVKRPFIVFAAAKTVTFVASSLRNQIWIKFTNFSQGIMHISTFWLKVGRSTALTLEQDKGHQELISPQITPMQHWLKSGY